jgi:hypothetical protein
MAGRWLRLRQRQQAAIRKCVTGTSRWNLFFRGRRHSGNAFVSTNPENSEFHKILSLVLFEQWLLVQTAASEHEAVFSYLSPKAAQHQCR